MSGLAGSRTCHVIKTEDEEFEFFLKVDEARRGQIITAVTKDGAAHRAGLRDGDRVIEINGDNVEGEDHNSVVERIRKCMPSNEITFLVIDWTHDPRATKTSNSRPKSNSESTGRPRICKIKKKNDSFGFFLEAHGESNPGHFIQKVTKGGAADGTGLQNGDRVIAVGKTNVEHQPHSQVVSLIKKSGTKVSLLVIDEESYQDFKSRNIPITEKMAKARGSTSSSKKATSTKQLSNSKTDAQPTFEHSGKVRVTHVFKHPDRGYGFYLRSKRGSAGEYIGDIEAGGAADMCGLRNDDRVVAVNGKSIIGLPHTDVISLIKSKRCQVVFVVMDEHARRKFEDQDDFPSGDDIVRTHPHIIRSVKLEKSESGYGLYLKMEKGCPFHIISDIEEGGAASKAGLRDDEIVIAVEGSSVLSDTHEDCVQKIKDAGNAVEMLVCDRKSAEFLLKVGVAVGLELYKEWPGEEELKVPTLEKPKKPVKKEDEVIETVARVAAVAAAVNDEGMKPRLCRIVKRDDGFGFFLKDDKGHYLINVEADGPAFHAGILEYDRIIEVNSENVEKFTHNDVVSKIRQSGNEVTFLVVNKEEDKYFREREILITSSLLTEGDLDDYHKPRLCTLKKTSGGYGFHLMGDSEHPGQYIREIVDGEPADVAGLRNGDRIIEVNGVNMMNESHDDVVKKIKERNGEVTFLVIDKQGEAYYKQKGIAIVANLIVAKSIVENGDNKSEKDAESVSHGSVSSSIVEAHVHQEDTKEEQEKKERDINAAEVAATVVAVKAVEEVIEEIKDQKEEEAKEEREEQVEKAMEEVTEQINEVLEEQAKEDELGIVEKAAVAVVASAVVEEVVENRLEEKKEERVEEAIEDIAEAVADKREEEEKAEAIEEAIESIQDQIDDASDEPGLDAGEKFAAGIVAAAVVNEALEDANEDAQSDRKSSSSEEEETLKEAVKELVEENEGVAEVLVNHVEDSKQEEESPQEVLKEAIEDALENLDNAEKVNGEVSDHEDEVEREAQLEPEFVAPAVIAAAAVAARAPSPEPVREPTPPPILSNHVEETKTIEAEIKIEGKSKSVEATITIQKGPEPAPVIIEAAANRSPEPQPPKPLAAVLTQQTEVPKLRPTPEPQKVPFTWGQHSLRPVNRQPQKPAAVVAEAVEEKSEDAPPVRSTVAAMRAEIERRNRENQRDALANEIKDELAQLSKQNGTASKRIQMFGGSVKKPTANAPPQKQKSWTGEGMTIKIVET